ncbi:MAG: alpha/beta hydrolase [Actinobacteria bacterium]|nr:alpha/beta hydrolase [Actinomycetota bacterium]MBU1945106.1 alpha/beta hydrolase [Actinomycetota bacterium]MBU2686443.1 alpha/beta hydrolase [Actinomycetota bacterium]
MRRSGIAPVLLMVALLVPLAGCGSDGGQKKVSDNRAFFESQPLQKVQVGDIEMACKSFGEGRPLFMIPAFAMTMDVWDPVFLEELSTEYRVIIFDNRGMGETTSGTREWTIDQFADDTAGLIEALGYRSAFVLGWSVGGDIALSLVVNHPERVIKLISYAGDCGGTQKVEAPEYKEVLAEVQDVDAPLKRVLGSLFPPEWMEEHPDYWKDFPFPRERSSLKSIGRQDLAYETWEGVYNRLTEIEKPVLVVGGTEDVSTPPENLDILGSRIPGCWVVRYWGAGHGLQYQYPTDFAGQIVDFIDAPPTQADQV